MKNCLAHKFFLIIMKIAVALSSILLMGKVKYSFASFQAFVSAWTESTFEIGEEVLWLLFFHSTNTAAFKIAVPYRSHAR